MEVAIAEIIGTVAIVTIVGILLVSIPITRRLGRALEEWIRLRSEGAPDRSAIERLGEDVRNLARHVEAMDDRLQLLSERQDFTESLVDATSERRSIT